MVSVRFDKMALPTVIKGPIPTLQLKVLPRISTEGLSEAQAKDPGPLLISLHATGSVQGVPIDPVTFAGGLALGQPLDYFGQREALWNFRLPRYLIDAIESQRVDNVGLQLTVELLVWLPHTQENRFPWQWTNAQWSEEIPLSRWLTLLDELGYSGGWAVELTRPRTQGMDSVRKYLEEAETAIESRNPKAALVACRQAWVTTDSILEPLAADVNKVIDGLSRNEAGKDSKSKRIEKIRAAVTSLTQIGPHEESYDVTMDDAVTGYRLTLELVAYISKKIRESEDLRRARQSA